MCTLIVGRDVLGPRTVVMAANRDEDPARPSDPPGLLDQARGVVGGRDRKSGGTWLAVRDACAVAMLNRRPAAAVGDAANREPLRSRGLLALDIATAAGNGEDPSHADAMSDAARRAALASLEAHRYAPFSVVFVSATRAWTLGWDGRSPRVDEIGPAWHVITHADLDDPGEPRTRRLLGELRGFAPHGRDAAWAELIARLAQHDEPRVCLHDGRMRTVSFSLLAFTQDGVAYRHGEGRPCERDAVEVAVPRREEHV